MKQIPFLLALWISLGLPATSAPFSYQGSLTTGGAPANGQYEMLFGLFDSPTNGLAIGESISIAPVPVTNGLFDVLLDFGPIAFNGSNRWLEISLTPFGSDQPVATLKPRQLVAATPYALHAFNAQNLASFGEGPLDLTVQGIRALRLEIGHYNPNISAAPNVIGGAPVNSVNPILSGVTIAGGGAVSYFGDPAPNTVDANFSTIGGGMSNSILNQLVGATIAGGMENTILWEGTFSTIGGGYQNKTGDDAGTATIAGGRENTVTGGGGSIGGGWGNTAAAFAVVGGGEYNGGFGNFSTIGGGMENTNFGPYSTVSGGYLNVTFGGGSTVAGGHRNLAAEDMSTIGGGALNQTGENGSTVGGGANNNAGGKFSTVSGGTFNRAQTWGATVSGGTGNINSSENGVVSGGESNVLAGGSSSTISGGVLNSIQDARASVIAGGRSNIIHLEADFGEIDGTFATIGGGGRNAIGSNAWCATIAGGVQNTAHGPYSTVSGGSGNFCPGIHATVGGGLANSAAQAQSTVSGGFNNSAAGQSATIGGGSSNWAPGDSSTISGGGLNRARGKYSVVPGGLLNFANSDHSTAAGRRAHADHPGAFVWGDSTDLDVASSTNDQWTVRASGGVRFFSNTNATTGVELAPGSGSWAVTSDRNSKENIKPVSSDEILEKVAALPIATWNYKSQHQGVLHIGPMAQDFKAAFAVGEKDTTISAVDADGVALAAIQGLNQKLTTLLKAKDAEILMLNERLERLEKLLTRDPQQ